MDEIMKDSRFAHIPRDPRFKRIPKKERKVKIDKRFSAMFSDERFKLKYTVDKRGRPAATTSTEDLKRYYDLGSSSESEGSSDNEGDTGNKNNQVKKKQILVKDKKCSRENKTSNGFTVTPIKEKQKKLGGKQIESVEFVDEKGEESDDEHSESDDGENQEVDREESDEDVGPLSDRVKERLQDLSIDYARGEGVLLTDSSSEESSEDEGDNEVEVDHGWGELDRDAEHTNEVSHRLALCNMDWDRVHAQDLMVLFNSFIPKGGIIHSISVYPSEYGLKRMKEEEEKGPQELRELAESKEGGDSASDGGESKDGKDADEEGEEGDHYRMEKLRQYQLSRLKYYYAVLVCDSAETASAIYDECDGMEYESTAARLDLRFIPDDTSFDQEPREMCTELPNMKKYEPLQFTNTALQQSKVHLTWDETDPRRTKFTSKIMEGKVDDVDDNDLKVYLASSSSDDEGEEGGDEKEDATAKYRALLQSMDTEDDKKKKKNDVDMEVTWGIGLKEKVDKKLKEGDTDKMTPFEKLLQKKKEKRKAKREGKKQKHKNEESDEEVEKKVDELSSEDDIPSDIDMNDEYFKEEFENEEFEKQPKKENKKGGKKKKGKAVDDKSEKNNAELELLLMDEDDGRQHFSLSDLLVKDKAKKKGKKRKKAEEEKEKKPDEFQINVKDERFSALFTSHLFNIDPADPHYKKTSGMEALRKEKLNRRQPEEGETPSKIQKVESSETRKLDPEMSLLVKNIKRKTKIAQKN